MRRQVAFPLVLATVLIIAASGGPVDAGTISLRWDPVSDPQLAGYRVYHGPATGSYDRTVDLGTVNTVTLTGVPDCATRYVAVRSMAQDGSLSAAFSAEVSGWPRPELTAVTPASVGRGTQATVVLTGNDFRPGSSVLLSDPAIQVTGTAVDHCGQITAQLTVGAGAALGPVDITVVHPDTVYGTGTGLFDVQPVAPTISGVAATAVADTEATIVWTTDIDADSQVLHRRVGDSVWQATAIDPTPTTDHQMLLTGLSPQTAYEYTVQSTGSDGLTSSQQGPTSFTTSAGSFAYLRIEAESMPVSGSASVASGSGAFRGGWVEQSPTAVPGSVGSPAGSWDLPLHLPHAASWTLWLRMTGDDPTSDGWQERIDGGSWAAVLPAGSGSWHWVAARTRNLAAGGHTWTLGGLDPGARLDRILLTDDPSFLPTEAPGGDVTPPAGAGSPQAVPGDGQVVLGWSTPPDPEALQVIVRYRADGVAPLHRWDGQPVIDRPAVGPGADGATHTGLVNGTTYHYGIFFQDPSGNVSDPAALSATPQTPVTGPPAVENLARTDVYGG